VERYQGNCSLHRRRGNVYAILSALSEEDITMQKTCSICGRLFETNKYRPNQAVCSDEPCQYQRQIVNMKRWRGVNPNYFKTRDDPSAKLVSKVSRQERKEYIKNYRAVHKEAHRDYMRKYMRLIRERQKEKQ
jgi:hypothetical protein